MSKFISEEERCIHMDAGKECGDGTGDGVCVLSGRRKQGKSAEILPEDL